MTTNPYRKRNATPIVPRDPTRTIEEHGIHGDRETLPRETQPIVTSSSRRVISVPIEKIRPGNYQKRESVDPKKYQQLKSQIQELGLNFVAILCVDPDDNNFYNPMMGGHLRIQAASELGITEISSIIREYDQEAMAKGTYYENNGRQPLTLIEEGFIFKQLQEDKGWTQEEIAQKLLVPGGRSHVVLCLLTTTEASDIQDMLRQEPRRGYRCFYYLRKLNSLGEEKAKEARAPIIRDFLEHKLSTDEVGIEVQRILDQKQGEDTQETSLDTVKRQSKITTTIKTFQRFEKEIGDTLPSPKERETLLQLKAKIENILERQ